MEIRPLRGEELEAFVDDLWIPFQREAAADEPFHPLVDDLRTPGIDHREDRLADDDAADLVAVVDGDRVGFASATREPTAPVFDRDPNCHVSELYVAEAYRRRGVATALLDACVDRGREWGCETASISVAVDNDAALALYEREGFEVRRRRLLRGIDGRADTRVDDEDGDGGTERGVDA
ncbi:GNAT family N-acetyltransferase [Halobaculum rubrum]|uniref:GNAT family N-acetyltransferase n=1 Tax=Halobaculum rubrum TaxID=2872158 RepID=UPI001CA3BDAD|nr:GNAT family N-acetyltransferase [Halobaculum rubrum]QZX99775.1 GNAT family N-acetyltransferase [Halobaculum rubrum]